MTDKKKDETKKERPWWHRDREVTQKDVEGWREDPDGLRAAIATGAKVHSEDEDNGE